MRLSAQIDVVLNDLYIQKLESSIRDHSALFQVYAGPIEGGSRAVVFFNRYFPSCLRIIHAIRICARTYPTKCAQKPMSAQTE